MTVAPTNMMPKALQQYKVNSCLKMDKATASATNNYEFLCVKEGALFGKGM